MPFFYTEESFITYLSLILALSSSGTGAQKVIGATAGDLASLTATGDLADSGVAVSTDGTLGGATPLDTLLPTQKAIQTFFTNASLNFWDTRGQWDALGGLFPTTGGSGTGGAIAKNDLWIISVAGTIAGKNLRVGDVIIALVDSPAQTLANWNTQSTVYDYIPAQAQAFDSTNVYVNLITGIDTNNGTSDSPFLTLTKALSVISVVGATIHVIGNNALNIPNITIASITNSLVIKGYSANQFGGLNTNKYIKLSNFIVSSVTGIIILENVLIDNFTCNCSATLINSEITQNVIYTANNSNILYSGVNHTLASHTFIHNGLLSGKLTELAECQGNVINLPLILEDVISASLLSPPLNVTLGDRYLINGTGTGDWLGNDNKIASWNGTAWIYQPLITGNIITTQDTTPLSFQYNAVSNLWNPISKWLLSTKTADEISAGLMSTNDYLKLLYILTATNVLASNNAIDERLVYNPTSTHYEFKIDPKFSSVVVKSESNLSPLQTNINLPASSTDSAFPIANLIAGNIVVTLPEWENNPLKSSYDYDGDVIKVQFVTSMSSPVEQIIVVAPNSRNIVQTIDSSVIGSNFGFIVRNGVTSTFRWSDNNSDPNNRLKPTQWEVI